MGSDGFQDQKEEQIFFTTALDKDQVQLLRKAFDAFDTEKKGWIGTNMVATILDMLGQPCPQSAVDSIIAEIDKEGKGEMDFEMFCILASKFIGEKQENTVVMQTELREAFRFYDKEGNGYITLDVLREILLELDPNLSAEELDGMIEEIDQDGSGTIDFDEFKAMMTGD